MHIVPAAAKPTAITTISKTIPHITFPVVRVSHFFTRQFTLWNHAAYKIRQIPRTTPVRFPMFLIPFVTNGYRNMNTPANPAMNNTILSHNFFNFPYIPPVFLHNSPFSGVYSMFIASKCIKMPSSLLQRR